MSFYRNLKVHHLFRKGRHCILEAEPIVPNLVRREDKVALSLLHIFEDDLVAGAEDGVVDVE